MMDQVTSSLTRTLFNKGSLLLISLLFIGVSCKKNKPVENELPPLTHEGKNTFGCKINGENWVAKTPGSIGGPLPLYGERESPSGRLFLHAAYENKEKGIFQVIDIDVENTYNIGYYDMLVFYGNQDVRLGFHQLEGQSNCSAYYYDSLNPGTINITYFDTTNFIISGTFEMELIPSQNCSGENNMVITDGRFDLKY